MISEFSIAGKIYKGISYYEYLDRTKIKLLSTNLNTLTSEEKELLDYTRLNLQRNMRIEKNYIVPPGLKSLAEAIDEVQLWAVITEDWCGDSAQNLPYIYKIAECNPLINIRILLRDSHPEVMDQYLTNGTRSIPKLIAFDTSGNELFLWGPRPAMAQKLFMQLRNENIPQKEIDEILQKWYTENNGKELEKEFIEVLSSLSAGKK